MNEPDDDEQDWESGLFLGLGIVAVIITLIMGYYR